MAKIVANGKGRQVLGDLGNVGGLGGKKGSFADLVVGGGKAAHDIPPADSLQQQQHARAGRAAAAQANPRTDMEVREYADDIFAHFSRTEAELLPSTDYMDTQPELTPEMRSVCLDWIIECATRLRLAPETLFLTVNVLDRFLAVKPIQRKRMQLVTMVSFIIASKYEEVYPPRIGDFRRISADAFSIDDMLRYEHSILHALNYTLTVPTPFSFISRYLLEMRESGVPESQGNKLVRHATLFVAECAMLDLDLYLEHVPSLLGAAAVYAGRTITEQSPVWPKALSDLCAYELDEVIILSEKLLKQASKVKAGNLQSTIKRYNDEKRLKVAMLVN